MPDASCPSRQKPSGSDVGAKDVDIPTKAVRPCDMLTETNWNDVKLRIEQCVNVRRMWMWRNSSGGGYHLRLYARSRETPPAGLSDSWCPQDAVISDIRAELWKMRREVGYEFECEFTEGGWWSWGSIMFMIIVRESGTRVCYPYGPDTPVVIRTSRTRPENVKGLAVY